MIESLPPVLQALLGTLFTWGLTAAGSGVVFLLSGSNRKILDGSLGFAAGVMTAASFWSLLSPAIEMAEISGSYGKNGEWAAIPIAIGFSLGAIFVYIADIFMSSYNLHSPNTLLANDLHKKNDDLLVQNSYSGFSNFEPDMKQMPQNSSSDTYVLLNLSDVKQRRNEPNGIDSNSYQLPNPQEVQNQSNKDHGQWKRILLLIIAITVHNIPEGLAVGVGFGAVGKSSLATFSKAKNLAFGIGIQNFPEGMAVSLPLRATGHSLWESFWYGQLSGMVEPIAGILGALAVTLCEPILPYALSFAAGAMIFVVVDDIIPEAQTGNNGRLSSIWCMIGFIVMMMLDVGLG